MAGKKAPVPCPKCGGEMWDNIEGKRNPKAPDYACKNKEGCGAGVWLTDSEKNAGRGTAAANGGNSSLILDAMMYRCHQSAKAICEKIYGADVGVDQITATAHSIFIARCRGEGILKIEKPAPAPSAPPPPPTPEPAPAPYEPPDDDLPF